MANNDFLNKLLNLEKFQVTHTEFAGDEQITLFVESTLTVGVCPACGQVNSNMHDLSEV